MFFKSTDCTDIFPNNNASHFYVRLPEAVHFSQDYERCALVSLVMPMLKGGVVNNVCIVTNFVVENYVGPRRLPIVQRCMVQNADGPVFNFGQNLLYVGVKSVVTDIIEVGVLDGDSFDYVNFSTGTLYCAFHVD